MLAKKDIPASSTTAQNCNKELEYLYARRLTIDALIASLEEYNRFRFSCNGHNEQRTHA